MQTRSRPSLTGTGAGMGVLRRAIAGGCTVSKPSSGSSRTCNDEARDAIHGARARTMVRRRSGSPSWEVFCGTQANQAGRAGGTCRDLDKTGGSGHGAPVSAGADFARRYASWIEHRRWAIVVGSLVFAALAIFGASQLQVFADFSY